MKTITRPQNTILTAGLCSLALLLSLPASAVNVTKLDTTSMAADTSNWSAAPGTNDVGEFNGTPSSTTLANLTLGGSDLTLGGLQLDGSLTGPLTIASGNTLTLGMSGINMSAANNSLTMNCNLTLGSGYQAWTVASGKTLAINGTLTRAAGASMSFPTTGVTSTTLANDSTGILGGWATVTGTSDWATNSSATGVGIYTGYTSVSGSTTGAGASAQNWKNSGGTVTLTASATINSLNQQNDFTVNSGVTLTLGSGGLIFGSTERWFLGSSGFIKSGLASGELYIHANTTSYANGWNIQPQIIDGSVATAVIKDGPGQALFSNGNNNYTGGTYVNAGTVYLGAGSTGSGNSVTKGPLGTAVVTLNGGGLNLHNQTLGNNINIPAGASATIDNGGGNGILSGNISGVVPTFLGSGLTVLQGANTYSGNTTITVGTLGVGNAAGTDNNLSTGDVIVTNGGTLRVGYAVTSNGNKTYTPNNITLGGGTLYEDDAFQHLTGNINVTAASTLGSTYNGAGGDADKGLYVDGLVSGSSNLTVQISHYDSTHSYDTSYVIFTNNANTYSGTITVNENSASGEGGVYLGVNGSTALSNATINLPAAVPGGQKFGTSPVVFVAGLGSATLGALTGFAPVVLAGYDAVNHTYTGGGNIALTVGANNSTTNYSGVLSGGGSLIKAGSGTFTLTGTNTYTGSTTVSAGSLTIGGAGQLGSGYYSGAIINNASLNYSSSAAQALAGPISGSGTLTIAGGSTLAVGGLQSSSQNNVTVNDGATLIEAFTPAAQLTPTSLTVGNTTGATLGFVINRTSPAPLAPGTLTLNGTDTINILGGNLVAGNSYPLIAYTTKTGSGSFALTVPTGVAGYLSTSVNIIYFNVTGITNTIWTGAVNGTWDINTTANWTNAGTLGNTYIDGSLVQFDDTGLITTITNVSGTLSPLSVNVTNTAKNYTIKTVVGGYGGLTKTGTGSLTNTAANTYAGPTTISQGQVVAGVTSVANVSGAVGNNSAVTLGNDATAALNLNGFATQIGSLTGGGTTGGNVVLGSGTLTVGGDNSSPAAYGGVISGTGGLTKIGAGTLTVTNTNTYTGATAVSAGELVLTGNAKIPSVTSGFLVGNVSGASAAVYQSGAGTLASAGGGWQLGSTAGASGYYNLSAGTMNVTNTGEFDPGGSSGGAGTFGQFDMSGGTLNIGWTNSTAATYFLPNRGGVGESSVVNLSGGTVNINSNMLESASYAGFEINWSAGSQTNATTISGSAVFTSPSESVKLNWANNTANICSLNLNGGLFQTLGFTAARNASAVVNFNGGTLKAGSSANTAFFGNVASVYSYANGGTFDNNGLAIAIATALSSPSGSGVTSIAVGTAGSGYIVPPQVTITGSGTGATAYSTIDPVSGAVTGIIVTCPGMNYSSPTVTLAGGGGSGATAGTVSLAANTSGPMTFTGAGITTLSNAYYVTGGLNVTGGTLVMNTGNGTPSPAGDLTVSNATLTLDATSGTPLPANNFSGRAGSTINLTLNPNANGINATAGLYLGTNLTLNLTYGAVTANPLAAAINATGTLTKGTNIVINISAGGLSVGVFPLITTGAAVTTNNFTLGTLPPGIRAVLTNNTANSLDLLVYGAGQLLSWHGANADNSVVLTNWDINTSTNWYDTSFNLTKYLQYSGNSYGDNVTFGDSGYNGIDGTNHVYLPANVVPATVTFSASSPYHLTGPGGIGGTTSLLLTNGSGAVYLETSNSYTGGTIVGSGALVITNDNALGNASVGVTLAGGTLQLNSPITSSRSVAVTGNSMLGVPTNVTAQLNGALSGTNALTKTDNGTLTISGTSGNTGSILVDAGILNFTGAASPVNFTAGSAAGNAVLNITGNLQVVSNLFVGNVSGAVGVVSQTGGTLTATNILGDTLNIGNSDGTYGYYNAAGGTMNVDGISIGGENFPHTWPPAGNNANGLFEVHGAIVNNAGWIVLARGWIGNIGVLNMFSGSLTYGGVGSIGCNWGTNAQTSIINIMGGSVTSTNAGVNFKAAYAGYYSQAILNLNGGLLEGNSVTGPGTVNFNGGILEANANSSGFVSVTSANVYGNGATIDDGGYTVTASQPLLAPVGYGVSAIALSDGGAGYIAPPIVTISGGVGTNATAIATVSGGQVTGILITSPGTGYASGDATSMTVSFTGGGASATVPTVSSITLVPNTSGGLIKQGSGIVTLTGTNTYTGLTVVTNGTLLFGPVPQAGNQVVVANGAKFGVVSTSMSNSATIGALTLGNGSGAATLDFTYGFVGNPTNVTLIAGAVTNNGSTTIQIGGAFALGTFPVMQYSSLSGSFNSTVSAPRGMGASVSNDTVNKIIYVVVNSLASPIVWTGTNPNPGKTNLWDLNTTTNWLSGVDPTTYQEVLPPGDAVLFNDSGTGLVLLSNTASPASVTISNSSVNYTFQGSGHISGATGLTKTGAGTVTMSYGGNDYTGPTIVSNGTLIATGGSAIGDSSAVTLANAAGANLTISANETVGSLAGGGSVGGNVSLSGTLTAGGDNTSTTYAGAISGSGALTKVGTGAMSLGGSNSVSGNVTVNNGALNLTGSGSLNSPRVFLGVSGATGTMTINTSSNLTANFSGAWYDNGALTIGRDNGGSGTVNLQSGTIGVTGAVWVSAWGGTGNWNQTGGTANISGDYWVGGMQDNDSSQPNGSIGTAIITNATLSAGDVVVGRGGNNGNVATSRVKGDLTVANGGVVNSENDMQVGYDGSGSTGWGSYGTLTIQNGGIVNVASTIVRWMTVGRHDSIDATVNIKSGGTLNLNAGTQMQINEGNNSGTRVVNVEGLLQGTAAGGSYIDLNRNATTGGTTTFNITNGGVVAVDSIIGKANCTLNFDNGTLKATADNANFIGNGFTVNILPGGAILDTAGHNSTVVGNLLNNGVNEDGGLTKTGNGTLNLNGVNTYTNLTKVGAGTLGGTGTIHGGVVVSNAASLAPGAGIGTLTINGNLTLNAGSTNVFEVNGTTPANDKVVAGGAVNYGGVLNIVPTGTFTVGQQFQLFSGTSATNASNFASIAGSPGAGLAFSFTNGVLSVVSTGPTLTSVTPNPVAGSTYPVMLSLGGSGFTGASAVLLTNVTASAGASYVPTINSDTSISVSFVPGTTVSTWNATVVNGSPSAQFVFNVSVPPAVKIGSGVGLAGAGKLVLSGTNGTPGYSYVVLSTTNLNPPVVWSPVVTNTFDGSGNFAYTNTVSTVTNKLFLRIQQ